MAVSAVARNLTQAGHYTAEYASDHASGGGVVFDRDYDVSAGALLVVRVADVDVAVRSHSGSNASVRLMVGEDEGWSEDALEEMGFRVERTSEGIEITTESNGRGDWRYGHDDYDMRLEVTVPRRFDVQIQTGDGDIAVEAIEGSVQLHTGDGDIALEGAVGSEVLIQTGDGDVVLGRIEAGEVQVRTGDGDILIEELSGALRASTGDGDVMVHLARFEGLQVTTGDGDVTLYAPPGLAADLDFVGEEFFLDDAFALSAQLNTRRLEGALNGGGPSLSVRVGDGTIRLIER